MVGKVLGFALVLVGSTLAGNVVASSYGARSRQLGQLRVGLHLLKTEVAYAMGALPGALERVAAGLGRPVADLFSRTAEVLRSGEGLSPGEAWERSARSVFPETALDAGDLEVLLGLAGYLGMTDRDDQLRHLDLALERLAVREDAARAEQAASERMWRQLGLLGGLALGIALL